MYHAPCSSCAQTRGIGFQPVAGLAGWREDLAEMAPSDLGPAAAGAGVTALLGGAASGALIGGLSSGSWTGAGTGALLAAGLQGLGAGVGMVMLGRSGAQGGLTTAGVVVGALGAGAVVWGSMRARRTLKAGRASS